MILRRSASRTCFKMLACSAVAAGLTLAGCTQESIPPSPHRAVQQEAAQKGVNQGVKSKSGNSLGPPIVTKSVKGLIKKDIQE